MKKFVALFLAAMMLLGCTAMADNVKMDLLTFQFVPSKDADVIITGTANLPELVKAEMAKLGYELRSLRRGHGCWLYRCRLAPCRHLLHLQP